MIRWVPLLFVALALPLALALDMVPPNNVYGVRTAASLASDAAWYRANGVSGVCGVIAGLAGFWVNRRVARADLPEAAKGKRYLAVVLGMAAAIVVPGLLVV
ncbi:SdpI family protein [Tsuneonella flava]|uniref:SdpI family protein n=1 Tax=Tsuneonella flava TaxID=2055955 RepID=A0ABX7K9E7_9SPHN|nr:SdpI family protein [Tsuneonella flava]QSB44888.1 SdpI family protein [Tsuneonella flava]